MIKPDGNQLRTPSRKTLTCLYEEHVGKVSDKWGSYLVEYERLFAEYRERPVRLLEVGVQNGGSLEIWAKYFPNATAIIGCDINKACAQLTYDDPRVSVVVGDANSEATYLEIAAAASEFDIIIDDGSHKSGDIVRTFARYFPHLAGDGLYIAEDLHCSYWKSFDGGLYAPYSSIMFFKRLADLVNHEHWGVDRPRSHLLRGFKSEYEMEVSEDVLRTIHGVQIINSICVVGKGDSGGGSLGRRVVAGSEAVVAPKIIELKSAHPPRIDQSENEWSVLSVAPDEQYSNLLKDSAVSEERILQLSEELQARQRQLADQQDEIEGLKSDGARREERLAGLKQETSDLKLRVQQLNEKLSKRDRVIQEFKSSTSWRVTGPFRMLSRTGRSLLRNVRRAFRLASWLCTGKFGRAAEALLPYYRRFVPVSVRARIPDWLRTGAKRHLSNDGLNGAGAPLQPAPAAAVAAVEPSKRRTCKRILAAKNSDWDWASHARVADGLEAAPSRHVDEKVSIIMPTYNRAQMISSAIASVLEQTHKNLELIVVDDHSSDDTEQVVSGIGDPRIIYLKNPREKGVSRARNAGLEVASGEWIFFLDSDNAWKPQMVEFMLKHADASRCSAGYCAANTLGDNCETKFILYADFDFESCLRSNFVDMNCFFMRWSGQFRELRFDESLKRLVDWDLILRVAARTRVCGVPFVGVDYYDGTSARITNTEHVAPGAIQDLLCTVRDKARPESLKNDPIEDSQGFRVGVHLHIFHGHVVSELLEYLANVKVDFDLYVTTSLDVGHEALGLVRAAYPHARVFRYPNFGSDVAPFLELVSTLKNYPLVLKIHTKRDEQPWGNMWREALLAPILGSPELVEEIVERFRRDDRLAMACSAEFYLHGVPNSSPECRKELELISGQVGLAEQFREKWGFVAGTMFWARPQMYLKLARYMCDSSGYSAQFAHEGGVEHVLERALGLAVWQDRCNRIALVSMDGEITEAGIGEGVRAEGLRQTIVRLHALRSGSASVVRPEYKGKVSTAILCYNHEKYLVEAIESALAQTGDRNHEILLSDDGSTDGSMQIIRHYAEKYPHLIRNISRAGNHGVSENYRHCFLEASGDYVAILEGDDFWGDPEKNMRQAEFLETHPEATMVFSRIELWDEVSGERRLLKRQEGLPALLTGTDFAQNQHLNLIVNFSSLMFRKDVACKFPPSLFLPRLSEISLSFYMDTIGKIGFIDKVMSTYRLNSSSVWTGATQASKIRQAIAVREGALRVARPEFEPIIRRHLEALNRQLDSVEASE